MSNQRKFEMADMRRAIDEVGADPTKIAARLFCSRGTVYTYLRKHPELKAAFEARKGAAVQDQVLFSKERFEMAIKDSMGIKTGIAQRVGCSRQTVENALERWPDLQTMIADERTSIIDLAETKLMQQISGGELRAILFTLETLGKDRGWTKRTEVTGAGGERLLGLSPDVVKLVETMGLDMSEVVRQFESMVKSAAVQKGISP